MAMSEFRHLNLLPAKMLLDTPEIIPDSEGVYYVFFDGGLALLKATSYFDYSRRTPMTHNEAVHLYTGASRRMRSRALCHLIGGADQSSLRKTLIATEIACQAISKTNTPHCKVRDKRTLNSWLASNVNFAFVECDDAEAHELRLLRSTVSPLNLRNPKIPKYAAQLTHWRSRHFPRSGIF